MSGGHDSKPTGGPQSTGPGVQVLKHLFLISFTFAVLYPVLWVVKMAFTPSQGFDASAIPIPTNPSWDNFRHVLFDLPFFVWLRNSIIVSAANRRVVEGVMGEGPVPERHRGAGRAAVAGR